MTERAALLCALIDDLIDDLGRIDHEADEQRLSPAFRDLEQRVVTSDAGQEPVECAVSSYATARN